MQFNWQNLSPSLFLSFPPFNLSFILLCLFDFVTDIAAVTSNVKVADIAQVDTKTVIHWRLVFVGTASTAITVNVYTIVCPW